MTPGLGYSSASALATGYSSNRALSTDYPLINLIDILNPSKVARHTATGQTDIILTWPSAVQMQALFLINHNGTAACSATASRWSSLPIDGGSNPGGLIDSKTVAFPVPASGYPQVLPIVFDSQQAIRGVALSLTGNPAPWAIGALDASLWWELPGISPGYDIGVDARATRSEYVGGAMSDDDVWAPRTFSGQVDYIAMTTTATRGLDFQAIQGRQKPFVFVKDLADPTTWPRTAMQVRNAEVPPAVGALYRHDRFQLRLIEHWR